MDRQQQIERLEKANREIQKTMKQVRGKLNDIIGDIVYIQVDLCNTEDGLQKMKKIAERFNFDAINRLLSQFQT